VSDLPSLLLFFVAAAANNPALHATPARAQAVADTPVPSAEFARLDADGDGTISRLEAMKDPEVLRTFRRADRDKDGRLDPEEFATSTMLSRTERRRGDSRARVAAAP
jgi:EF hand domain-containing protein